jgi:hypothetical protein
MKSGKWLMGACIGGVIVLVVFVGIQFVPVKRDNPKVVSDFTGPAPVQEILRTACYNCHSNETQWPWYSRVAPVSWFLAGDVAEGREHLNFSEWGSLTPDVQALLRKKMLHEVSEGKMPLPVYLLLHPEARLKPNQIEILQQWNGNDGS